jgi:hypothetical protein
MTVSGYSMGEDSFQRQKAYRDYVPSLREKEEQELRVKMGGGVLGREDYRVMLEKQIIDAQRPKRGRPRK